MAKTIHGGSYSKNRGKRGEREVMRFCRDQGYEVHRTAQYKGKTGDAGDIEGLNGIHIECKRTERFKIRESMEQAIRDAKAQGKGNLPVVFQRGNNQEWLAVMRAEDWFKLYREYEAGL